MGTEKSQQRQSKEMYRTANLLELSNNLGLGSMIRSMKL